MIEPWLFEKLKENYDNQYPNNSFIFINNAIMSSIGKEKMHQILDENVTEDILADWTNQLSSFDKNNVPRHFFPEPTLKDLILTEIDVETTTLNNIIEEYNIESIELLLIDVEGCEYDILMNSDFSLVKPVQIFYEFLHLTFDENRDIQMYLSKFGYQNVDKDNDSMIMEIVQ